MPDRPITAEPNPPSTGRGKKRALAALLSALVILIAAEVVIRVALPARWFLDRKTDCYWIKRLDSRTEKKSGRRIDNAVQDPELGWTMRPNHRDGDETVNSLGVRGERETPHRRTEGVGRVIVLGDSFTFGLGVGDDETYSARLEARLLGTEVLNLGVNGYGTDQQFLYWRRDGVRFAPDTVLIGVYVPDFHRNGLSMRELPKPRFFLDGDALVPSPTPLPKPRDVLTARSDSCGSGLRLLDAFRDVMRRIEGREPDGPFDEKARLMHGILEMLRDSVEASGARLGVLVIPDQTYRDYQDHERIERVVEDAARELGIAALNLTEPLLAWQERHPDEPLYDDEHGHWTPKGHDVAAEMIHAFVLESKLLGD